MTHLGHDSATPLVKAGTQPQIMLRTNAEALYYVEVPLRVPYFFEGSSLIPMFIMADSDAIEDIRKVLNVPFLHLSEWGSLDVNKQADGG